MRWDHLFDDLDGQSEAADVAEQDAELADRVRHATGRAGLLERLLGWPRDSPLALGIGDGRSVAGELLAVGPQWLALRHAGQECLVPFTSLRWLRPVEAHPMAGLRSRPAVASSQVSLRLGLTYALRTLARDRAVVQVALVGPTGTTLVGTVDRAGVDHFDLALHPADEPRRPTAVLSSVWIPFVAVAAIHGGQVWSDS